MNGQTREYASPSWIVAGLAVLLAVTGFQSTQAWAGQVTGIATITGDADSGIGTANVYTHKLDFQAAGQTTAVVNGVAFDAATGTSGTNWSLAGATAQTQGTTGAIGVATGQGIYDLLYDFSYNGNPAVMTLSGLTPGTLYSTRLYYRRWSSNRFSGFSFNDGAGVVQTLRLDEDADSAAHYMEYTFVAMSDRMVFSALPENTGSTWHFYGLTNQEAGPVATWTGAASSDWGAAANWTTGVVPSGAGAFAVLGAAGGSGAIDLGSTGRTVADLTFLGTVGTTVSSAGNHSLVFDATTSGGAAVINVAGIHAIHAPLALNSNLAVGVAGAADRLTLSGTVSDGTAAASLTKAGSGTLVLVGSNTYSGLTTISGGVVQVGNGGTSGTLGSGNVVNNATLAVNRSDSFTLAQIVSGSGSLIHAGSGVLALTAANTFSGNTTVTGGSLLRLANSLALQNSTLASSAVEFDQTVVGNAFTLGGLSGGGSIALQNNAGTPAAVALSVGSNGRNTTFAGSLSGPGALVKIGSGVLTLSGTNTQAGNTTVSAGTLSIATTGALPGWNVAGRYAVASGASLAVGNAVSDADVATILGTGNFAAGAAIGFDTSNGDRTYANAVANTAVGVLGLTKVGTGVLTLTGTNTYTGTTRIEAGTLRLGNASAVPAGRTLAMAGTGILDLNGYNLTVANVASSVATNTITDNGTVAGVSTLAMVGGAPATLSAVIKDGATRQLAVVLRNSNSGVTPFAVNTPSTFSGGLLLAGDASWQTRMRISSVITTVGSASAIVSSPFGTGAITIGSAATDRAAILFDSVTNNTLVNDVVFNTALGTDVVGGIRLDTTGNTFSGTLTANLAAASFNTGTDRVASATLTGRITGNNGLVLFADRGSLTLTLNNGTASATDYRGDTVIGQDMAAGRSATLRLASANQIPNGVNAGNVIIHSNGTGVGTLDLNGYSDTINGLSGTGIVDNTATGAVTLTVGDNNASSTFDGILRNTGGMVSLHKIGAGTLTLTGQNTYTGVTTLQGGILNVASVADYGVASAAGARAADISPSNIGFLFRGGTLQYTGDTAQSTNRAIRVSTSGGAIIDASGSNPDATLTFTASNSPDFWENSGNRSVTFTGTNTGLNRFNMAITQIGGLTTVNKTGAGTWVLSGTSSYTGATNVSGGTLLVTGSLANTPVAVGSGATLGGTGSIGGSVSINGGGTLSPGMSPGVLTLGSLALATGSTTLMEINGLARGTEYDGVNISTASGLNYGGTLSLDFGNASWFAPGTVLDLFSFTGTATGAFSEVTSTGFYAGEWTADGGGVFSLESGWQTLLFSQATGDLTVIPEPTAWLMLLCAACGLLRRRQR